MVPPRGCLLSAEGTLPLADRLEALKIDPGASSRPKVLVFEPYQVLARDLALEGRHAFLQAGQQGERVRRVGIEIRAFVAVQLFRQVLAHGLSELYQ
jgi:hypothetical protein